MNVIDKITEKQIRKDLPEFRVGDTIKVGLKIVEGKRERVQYFEGLVMSIQGSGVSKNFVVRKISSGVGVERTIPMNSPTIDTIEVIRKGKVRRAKLNYIRDLKSQPRIKERRTIKGSQVASLYCSYASITVSIIQALKFCKPFIISSITIGIR